MLIYNKNGVAVWSQPPARRTVNVNGKKYFLSVPRTLFRIGYRRTRGKTFLCNSDEVCVGFIDDAELYVYCPPLPNILPSPDFEVCMDEESKTYSGTSLDNVCMAVVADFWASEFDRYEAMVPLMLAKWQRKTLDNPNWVLSHDDVKNFPATDLNGFIKRFR